LAPPAAIFAIVLPGGRTEEKSIIVGDEKSRFSPVLLAVPNNPAGDCRNLDANVSKKYSKCNFASIFLFTYDRAHIGAPVENAAQS
jgi:cytidine deaminase